MQVKKCKCCKQDLFRRAKNADYCKNCARYIQNLKARYWYYIYRKKKEILMLLFSMIEDKRTRTQIKKIVLSKNKGMKIDRPK